jgi:photosystem II stability/assembly factor-like uncharacterized protein
MKVRALAVCIAGLLLTAASPFSALTFRSIGPTIGRIDAVSGVPGDPLTYFAGGLGGLWRSTDGGVDWKPVFDERPVTSIGAIAVAPSNHRIVYVGTGEPNMRNDVAFGDGVWRSEDGGTTWMHAGLDATSHIAQIAVDPHNAKIVYVAAVGDPFKPSGDRGIYKTVDGGRSWQHVLYADDTTGASSVVIAPNDPRVVFAAVWTVQRRPWMLTSGGPQDGLYRSDDAGATWTYVRGNGFPAGLKGRIGLAFAPSRPQLLYALIESKDGVLWRSDDGGTHWKLVSTNHALAQRPFYFSQLAVDPRNADHVFFPSIRFSESTDGGKTTKRVTIAYDHHQVWIDPVGGKRMIVGADAGVFLSADGGQAWRNPQLIVAQAYHVEADDGVPYTVCGEFQDPGAVCAANVSFTGSITPDRWWQSQGGESGWNVFAPNNRNIVYSTGYQEAVIRFDRTAGQGRVISPWPDTYSGLGAQSYKYRGAWVAPLAVSPLEPDALYFGANVLLKTTDGGATWREVSPDLTRDDKSKQIPSGRPITVDNAGTEVYDTISSIAESPHVKGELWVGTDDGLVWLTRDGGLHWNNVTAGVPNLPQWSHVSYVAPSPLEDGTAYLVADAHKLGDRTPYLYVTHDFGAHWSSIAGNLPRDAYARMLRPDPTRRDMLYAGTENGLWLSFDGGSSWQPLQNNLAHVPVYDFVVQPQFDDLVVGTHGRGVWILDDLTGLQQYSSAISAKKAYLFPVRNAYRWNANDSTWANGEGAGDNPAGSVDFEFYLHDRPAKPKKGAPAPVKIEIRDGTSLVRTIDVRDATSGVNRVYWDLNYDNVKPVRDYHINSDGFIGPQAVPGDYTITLVAAGNAQEQTLHVLADQRSPATLADMKAQLALSLRLRDDFVRAGKEITALLQLRDRLAALPKRARSNTDVASATSAMSASIGAALDALYQANATNSSDVLRYPVRLYERIVSLGGSMAGSDYAPTAADEALANQLESELNARISADDPMFGEQLKNLNVALARIEIAPIVVTR